MKMAATPWRRSYRHLLCILSAGAFLVLTGCMPEFPNLSGELIRSSPVEDVIAQTEALTFPSTKNYKALYFHVNSRMRACLRDTSKEAYGYILDSNLDEGMERGELAILRDPPGFGKSADTYILILSAAEGARVTIHTRDDYQLEKWMFWFKGGTGCSPEFRG